MRNESSGKPRSQVHIVPATPPAFNGVGDYARQLFTHWPEPRPRWSVASLKVTEGSKEAWPGVSFHPFSTSEGSLLKALEATGAETAVLHYVGHGYNPKGLPVWLPHELTEWKSRSNGRLAVFFHELFAVSPPWRSAFWLAPSAVGILQNICKVADLLLTSTDLYARQLAIYGRWKGPIEASPVGSNLPLVAKADHSVGPPFRVAIFGSSGTRFSALSIHKKLLMEMRSQKKLAEIVLLGSHGSGEDCKLADSLGPTEIVFDSEPDEVSRKLASCQLALISTEIERLGKSTVFASACQHRLIPVVAGHSSPLSPFLGAAELATQSGLDPTHLSRLLKNVDLYAQQCDWKHLGQVWKRALPPPVSVETPAVTDIRDLPNSFIDCQ